MPRSGTGVYSLPQSPFISGTVIQSSIMNSDLSDVASALTGSLATTGVSTMTAPIKGFSGVVSAPGFSFADFTGAGFYTTTGNLGLAISSVQVGNVSTSTTTSWSYKHFFADGVSFQAGAMIYGSISASVTITGDIIITGGLVVGFGNSPVADIVQLVDSTNYIDFNTGTNPIYLVDSQDFMFYDRTNNVFKYEIANTIIHTVTAGAAFFAGTMVLPRITAPTSASANQANIYLKSNAGTSRLAYNDENGVETFMGGPGQWELIAQTAIPTSVASITYSLSKRYSRFALTVAGVSVAGTGFLNANISDDAGVTLVSCRSTIINSGVEGFNITGLGIMRTFSVDAEVKAEINRADKTGVKHFTSIGSRNATDQAYFNSGQTASCGPVNAIVVGADSGNMLNGAVSLYGMIAI